MRLASKKGGSRRRYSAKSNPRAFLAENHVTGIKRTNGTQTPQKMGLSTLLKPPEKDKLDGMVLLGFAEKKSPLKIEMVNFGHFG